MGLNIIADALDEAAIVAITDTFGTITYANRRFCELSGYSREELLGQNHRIIKSGYHSPEFYRDMWNTISKGNVWEGEVRNRTKNGMFYWVHTTIVPARGADGKIESFVSVRYDITERKLAEEQLRKYADALRLSAREHEADLLAVRGCEENFRSIFNSTVAGLFVHDENFKVLDVNKIAGEIFDFDPSTRKGTLVTDVLLPEVHEPLRELLKGELARPLEARGFRTDGTIINLEITTRPIIFNGQKAWLSPILNIEHRKKMESQMLQQDRLASLGLLASSLAHEIGTPLGVIRGRAELLKQQSSQSEALQKNATVIVTQIDRVSKLIQSLLAIARGKKTDITLPVSVRDAVESVITLMNHELRKHEIQVFNEISPAAIVNAEREPLGQIFLNLFVNSVHAIADAQSNGKLGPHQIKLRATELGNRWMIEVEDSGTGIPEKNMREIFKPFFTTKDIGSGTGLGLAICYRMIESWGGTIEAQSKIGQWTIFRITLPKASAQASDQL